MGNVFQGESAHSAEHFGDARDHWWNADFLRLIAKRWRLDAVETVLDVGCGVGHWGQLLASVLREDVHLKGIDREPIWVEQARARAKVRGFEGRFSYQWGEAQRLPFPDDTFDLTTCQTVLIHVPDPAAVIAEMQRVTKPGGLVMVAEPNNLSETLLLDTITNRESIDDIVELVRFQLTCERGKIALGEGDNSLGDRVPGLFVAAGFCEVDAVINDKATAIFPPYTADLQRAFVEDLCDRVARRCWNWSEPEAQRLFLAGGGDPSTFARHFERGITLRTNIRNGLEDGTFHGMIGGVFYLVAGRKPV